MSSFSEGKLNIHHIPAKGKNFYFFQNLKYCLLLSFGILSFLHVHAQSPALSYARHVIDTLTSSTMGGRGYVDSSDWKAANFIRAEMMGAGLWPMAGNYFQPYVLSTNVFPGKVSMNLNGQDLTPGKDFLVDAGSGSCKGKFKAVLIRKSPADTSLSAVANLLKSLSHQKNQGSIFLVAKDDFTKPQYGLWRQSIIESDAFGAEGAIEFSDNKLTWHASQEQLSFCYVQVKGKMPDKKKSVITLDIESELKKNYASNNVIGYVKGTAVPDSFLVFTAHYDHLGQMGKGTYFPGANDNASGTSMVLNLARYFAQHPSRYSVAVMLFSGEELGLLGSQYYAGHPLFPLSSIKFLINMDIVGTGDEGIKVVNATEFPKQFDQLVKLNDREQLVKVVSPRGKAANSDHYPFYEKGVPCFFIYTMGGISAYHDVYDRPETLPLTDYEDLFKLLIDFTNTF